MDPIVASSTFLERQTLFTLLGVRFWDPAYNQPVTNDLSVTAWPENAPEALTPAFRTASGIYAFRGLTGLRHLERPLPGITPWDDEVTPQRFIVETVDLQRRFLPLVFTVNVPFRGVFPIGALYSPDGEQAPGCLLFSAPNRAPGALAVLRAHLVQAGNEAPAANAVLELTVDDNLWIGVADEQGRLALPFPYPPFTRPLGLTSPETPLLPQAWPVSVRVRWEPGAQVIPPGASSPEIRSLARQEYATLWLNDTGVTDSALALELKFREQLVVQTIGSFSLWLEAGP